MALKRLPNQPPSPRPDARFAFGENWRRYLEVLDEERIAVAERSLQDMLECETLEGRTFLDIGSGSGLFSLAAFRLGAQRVHSIDIDPSSVRCTQELRARYARDAARWVVEVGSVLDEDYLRSLGQFDIVYSWGVLHHTGDMKRALANAALPVAPAGRLFIAVYNDEGRSSRRWVKLKWLYNQLPRQLRIPYVLVVMAPRELRALAASAIRGRPQDYIRTWMHYKRQRGMSRWHDMVDWVGGYPFEFATATEIFNFYRHRGFVLVQLVTGGSMNQFVFERPLGR